MFHCDLYLSVSTFNVFKSRCTFIFFSAFLQWLDSLPGGWDAVYIVYTHLTIPVTVSKLFTQPFSDEPEAVGCATTGDVYLFIGGGSK